MWEPLKFISQGRQGVFLSHKGDCQVGEPLYPVYSINSVPTFCFPTPASGAETSLTAENCLLPGLLVNFLVSVFFSSVYFPNI